MISMLISFDHSRLDCSLCLPKEAFSLDIGVQNYPRKGQKTKVRDETSLVCIVTRKAKSNDQTEYLMFQRPKTGLLANLLEFPSFPLDDPDQKLTPNRVKELLKLHLSGTKFDQVKDVDSIGHQFSHIKQSYRVWSCSIKADMELVIEFDENKYQRFQWLTQEDLLTSPISTAMKKVFKCLDKSLKRARDSPLKGQKTISSFFGKKSKQELPIEANNS